MGRYVTQFPVRFHDSRALLVYAEYAKTSNLFAVSIYGLMLVGGQTAQIGKMHCPVHFRLDLALPTQRFPRLARSTPILF